MPASHALLAHPKALPVPFLEVRLLFLISIPRSISIYPRGRARNTPRGGQNTPRGSDEHLGAPGSARAARGRATRATRRSFALRRPRSRGRPREGLDDRLAERRQIVRLAARDDVVVDVHLL